MKKIIHLARLQWNAEVMFKPYFLTFVLLLSYLPVQLYAKSPPLQVPLMFPEAEAINKNTIRVPFRLAGHLIAVKAAVGERTGIFIIDTGASKLILNEVHFPNGWTPQMFGTASAGVTGSVERVKRHTVDHFQWDSLYFDRLTADVINLSHIEQKKNIEILGLIGYNLLREFEILIDFQLRQLTLSRLDKAGNLLDSMAILEHPTDSIAFNMQAHFIALEGAVAGHSVIFGLDTGAELNLLHHKVKRKVLDHFEISKRVLLNGTGKREVEVIAGKLYRYQCGSQNSSAMHTLLTNMRDMNASYGTQLDGLMGYEFFSSRRTIINYKKKKLYFLKWHRP
jgi:predicted aspartyl protease